MSGPFRARVGLRRCFPTSADQVRYERVFQAFPDQPWGKLTDAARLGWLDAEEAHAEAQETERRAVSLVEA